MKTVKTYTATIYVGLKHRATGHTEKESTIYQNARAYCNSVGLCCSISRVDFVYTGGEESGFAIGLINYPRFPISKRQMRKHAICLAEQLMLYARQCRVSIVFPDKTIMLSNDPEIKNEKPHDRLV